MARPKKRGLAYFPLDVSIFDDFKIIDLLDQHGAIGFTIYIYILCQIYKNGYYLEIEAESLAVFSVRTIGGRWLNRKVAARVIRYCADIGLFDKSLLSQNVITSVAIQQRYLEVTKRNEVDIEKYWLLNDDNQQPVICEPSSCENVTKTPVSVTKTPVSVTETQQNKIKQNEIKSKVNIPPELAAVWDEFKKFRKHIRKPMTEYAETLLMNKLQKLSSDVETQKAILNLSLIHI